MNSVVERNTVKIRLDESESSCVSDLLLDYDNGVVSVSFRNSLDKCYWYDCEHSGVLDCIEEASQSLEEDNISMGRIINYYIKSGEMKPL